VKNRKNGALNPNAFFQTPVTFEEVMNSRVVATPLRLLHCCPTCDGAAAIILCSKNKLKSKTNRITVAASVLASGVYGGVNPVKSVKFPPLFDIVEFSAKQAYEISGYGPEDMNVVQAYDTMAPSELWNLEKLGFCKKGEVLKLLSDGELDIHGKLPVNTDGGLLSRGHPLGATAAGRWSQDRAGSRQRGRAEQCCHHIEKVKSLLQRSSS
jgi:acetyl-CoA acetyltransferase